MRKFIISDLHGCGCFYDSVINFLENINKTEDVMLYINGDLIDRGKDAARMLLDVKRRIEYNISFPIVYLGGNHELMMYQAAITRDNGTWNKSDIWFTGNFGNVTLKGLNKLISDNELEVVINFISNLKIYHKFEEKIDNKQIVLVHAKCPRTVKDICDIKIKDNNHIVYSSTWFRKNDGYIGNKDYFTIIGHTPVDHIDGYYYDKDENTLNMDGGCGAYSLGLYEYNHFPVVEIENNRLNILTFNSNNEIIYGNYFSNGNSYQMDKEKLEEYRNYLNKDYVLKK